MQKTDVPHTSKNYSSKASPCQGCRQDMIYCFLPLSISPPSFFTMGNTASSSSSSIRVITGNGTVLEFARPVKASELIRTNPRQFVCDSDHLRVGCRVPGLAAGDGLEPGRLYFILPIDLLYSVLTEEEMASLSCMASSKKKPKFGRRIFPVLSDFCLIPSEAKKMVANEAERWRNEVDDGSVEVSRLRSWASWRPALDTIEEGT